jgi:hypothetical protein
MELLAETVVGCSPEELTDALGQLNVIYPLYCPEEHIAGKRHTMKYKVSFVVRSESGAVVVYRAMFPRSLLGIRLVFNVSEAEGGVRFSRRIVLGGHKIPVIGEVAGAVARLALGEKYVNEMAQHNREDLAMLGEYIETHHYAIAADSTARRIGRGFQNLAGLCKLHPLESATKDRAVVFSLDKVLPWGRSYDEYVAMFALCDADLRKRIVGCGDGPARFNAGMHRRGLDAISIDPLYRFGADEIRARISEAYDQILEQTRRNQREFVWTTFRSVDELARARLNAMEEFLADYPIGRKQGRYVPGELLRLPLPDGTYDIAVCSHLLFVYSEQLDMGFHLSSILDMCRIAAEVRVFPLVELSAPESRHLEGLVRELSDRGFGVRINRVEYEFRKGGNTMLRVLAT